VTRLIIVAASAIARAGLTALIAEHTQAWEITSVASLPEAGLELTEQPVSAVLMDLSFQGVDLVQQAERSGHLAAEATVALVGEVSGASLVELLQAGVQAVLPADATGTEMLAALEAALAGLVTLHPTFLEELMDNWSHPWQAMATEPAPPLTPREIEVLTRLAQGTSNKAIAEDLMISEHTVKFHLGAIFAKLGVSTRTEAAMAGARLGLIML
jgi:NarL family two-component system response regulator YdfI